VSDARSTLYQDLFGLDGLLTEEEREVRERVRAFSDAEVIPIMADCWERGEFPFQLVPKLAALGICGDTIKGYGCAGLSAVGAGLAAMDKQFDRPIASFQLVQDKFAKILADITTMFLLCIQLGRCAEAGKITDVAASLAKMNHAQKARRICLDARDIMGGNGILYEYHVARHWADMEAVYTYEAPTPSTP
jgi:alkylation response protein AidB-like acyl-CoA dehydrogenase